MTLGSFSDLLNRRYFSYNVYWVRILGLALFFVRLLRDPLISINTSDSFEKREQKSYSSDKVQVMNQSSK